jgi:RpiR family transcriptional regulator, carbohydrate utilization regulator
MGRSDLSHVVAQQNSSPFETVFRSYAQTISEMAQIGLSGTLERARKVLAKARRVELFSTGSSFPVAYMTFCEFKLLGLPATANFDSQVQIDAAAQLDKRDVAFGVSCSETARSVLNCLKSARANGATTIYLTSAIAEPTIELADVVLCVPSIEVRYSSTEHFDSCLGQLAIIDTLLVLLAHENEKCSPARLREGQSAI